MATLREVQKRARTLSPTKISDDLFDFIRTIEAEMVRLNRDALNKRSEDVQGKPIGFYSAATEYITLNDALLGKGTRIKREGDPFDLEQTGVFLKSLFARVDKDSVFFDASDPKKREVLTNTLTNDLFGLQDQDLKRVIDERILPFFITYFKNNLG